MNAVQTFLASLAHAENLSTGPLACPTDQYLFFRSLKKTGGYANSRTIASECAAMQYCIRSIKLHTGRLEFLKLDNFEWHGAANDDNNSQPCIGRNEDEDKGTDEDSLDEGDGDGDEDIDGDHDSDDSDGEDSEDDVNDGDFESEEHYADAIKQIMDREYCMCLLLS